MRGKELVAKLLADPRYGDFTEEQIRAIIDEQKAQWDPAEAGGLPLANQDIFLMLTQGDSTAESLIAALETAAERTMVVSPDAPVMPGMQTARPDKASRSGFKRPIEKVVFKE